MVKLSKNSEIILSRYLLKDEQGKIIEKPESLFKRVAQNIAKEDARYGAKKGDVKKTEKEFYDTMNNLEFLPNLPVLANAGRKLQQLAACFAEDQPIITSEGVKPISKIKIGDSVLTAKGRFRMVTQTAQRMTESYLTIDVHKLPNNTLKVTKDHPILALREGKPNWISAGELKEDDLVAVTYPKEVNDIEFIYLTDFLDNKYLIENEKVYRKNFDKQGRTGKLNKQIKPLPNKIQVDANLMRLLGYYAAEGDIDKGKTLRFTFSTNEEAYANDVINIIKEKFSLQGRITKSNHGNWINAKIHSKPLCSLLEKIMGRGYANKKVPLWILKLPKEKQQGFIVGCFRGDDTLFLNKHVHNAKAVMCNTNLIQAIYVMLLRRKVVASFRKEFMPKLGRAHPFSCTITSVADENLLRETYNTQIRMPAQIQMQRLREVWQDDMLFLPIKRIKEIEEPMTVYNFEVDEDHTYAANNVAVHNCFVIPVPDSTEGIFQAVKELALVQRTGGGTGFSFSRLRPEGSYVSETGGIASGPVSFMKVFDAATGAIKEGGIRRGANMGILRVDHPDIEKFITAKEKGNFPNFNISVAMTDKFMQAVEKDKDFDLIFEKKVYKTIRARELFDKICKQAWLNGDPGIIFIDKINKANPTPKLGEIEATNPCGEQPLLPYESCILGSINLSKFVKGRKLSLKALEKTIRTAVHFLDNAIDASSYPIPEIEKIVKANRKIGLGVMGFADTLIQCNIPYDSKQAEKFALQTMKFIKSSAAKASIELAKARGSFPNIENSIFKGKKMRNATLTTIAPTGTIAIIANCSDGIEPIFAPIWHRHSTYGILEEIDPFFEEIVKKYKLSEEKIAKIEREGTLIYTDLPEKIKKVYRTALDISPEWHIRIQAAFQKFTDNAVSKTVNLPEKSTPED
ncbi:MAG: adenosylcobalamin-dependent ribonucleoside-diphosphate reductase, partial [Candidatus Pacearchaeota archaeon]